MSDELIRKRAIGLFRYLGALAELRAKKTRDVASYENVFWFHELPQERECFSAAWHVGPTGDEENWLRIDKPKRPPLPRPPAECEHWFNSGELENVIRDPLLFPEIVDPDSKSNTDSGAGGTESSPKRLTLGDHPQVMRAWEEYVEKEWRPWRLEYQRWESIQRAYRKLFTIFQEQERRGEQYELVVGVGMFLWTTQTSHTVRRPVLTVRAAIALERESGRITVGPVADGADLVLEQDMLEVNECPPHQDQPLIEKQLAELESLWDRTQVVPILKGWLQTLRIAADAEFRDELECPDRATSAPRMAFAPILILRRRGERTLRDALKKVVKQLDAGGGIPEGIQHLCGREEIGERADSSHERSPDIPEIILFPLPTNDEQLAIVRRINCRSGALVQGPPGTGKSHAIVNLVSHFLAAGKRVLVTSQTPRTLKVLRDKFPLAIRALTVSLLGDDAESRSNLEYSVQGILRHFESLDEDSARVEIAETMRRRQSLLSQLSQLRRRMRELRESETVAFALPGTCYEGTAQRIAMAVSRDAPRFSWLVDRVRENADAPLTNGEFDELLSLWERCGVDGLSVADFDLPCSDSLPTPDQFQSAAAALDRAKEATATLARANTTHQIAVQRLQSLGKTSLEELLRIAAEFLQCAQWLGKRSEPWIERVRKEVATDSITPWLSLENATTAALGALCTILGESGGRRIRRTV